MLNILHHPLCWFIQNKREYTIERERVHRQVSSRITSTNTRKCTVFVQTKTPLVQMHSFKCVFRKLPLYNGQHLQVKLRLKVHIQLHL